MPSCPVCSAPIDLEKTPTAPFCSERCRLVDLGRWLDEAYAVPEPRREADPDDDAGPDAGPDADPDEAAAGDG
ncbi:MAG: DNA gyrase inhibitor YacG [Planctomycetia bacterium]|nr:DNA gyrase inhibitor YacG [Planctomycetia bacterium]